MKRLFLFFIILSGGILAHSEPLKSNTTFLGKDSIPFNFEENWKFLEADAPEMSAPWFNDSLWPLMDCKLSLTRSQENHWFKGIGWFRLHLKVDSVWVNKPLTLIMTHYGASEVFLDGRLIKAFGKISGADSSEYFNPQKVPFVIQFNEAGNHLLAIRYANYDANKNYRKYWTRFAGFTMSIREADESIKESVTRTGAVTFIFTLLLGIFFAMGLLHLLLYLYYRDARSNLWFSIFAFCLAAMFFITFTRTMSETPSFDLKARYLIFPIACTACLALSGFIHQLFVRKGKWLFYVITAIYLAAIIFPFFGWTWSALLNFALIFIVSLEAVVMIIIAIKRKVEGARIIGFGVLFLTLFLLSIFAALLIFGDFEIDDSTIAGAVISILMGCAILSMPVSMSVYLAWSFSRVSKDLSIQLKNVKQLSQKSLEQEQEKSKLILEQNIILEQKVEERTADLKAEKKKSDDLLLNILPEEIAEELKMKGEIEARQFDMVTVLFTDFVNFTGISETMTPKELVKEIDICFKAFDEIVGRTNLEKIKTIGDAYLAVCGIPEEDPDHAANTVRAAVAMRDFILKRKNEGGKFEVRLGIHTGPLVAGIVGVKKFAYDIWGDTVNTAARMEQNSESGKINISGTTYELIKEHFKCEHRGKINAKNKGDIDMYFVT